MSTHVLLGPSSATWDEANDITFDIDPCSDLISLADIRFQCDLAMRADGAKLVDEELVCPVNNMLSNLFQNVQVTLEVIRRICTSFGHTSKIYLATTFVL